jgi:hypothetical protein
MGQHFAKIPSLSIKVCGFEFRHEFPGVFNRTLGLWDPLFHFAASLIQQTSS